MNRGWRYMEKRRHLSLDIEECMDFYSTLLSSERCPSEDCQTKFDGCRVKGIDVPAKVEDLRNSQSTSLFYHVVGKLFEDVIVSVLVRFCQIAACNPLTKSEAVSLSLVGFHRDDYVS